MSRPPKAPMSPKPEKLKGAKLPIRREASPPKRNFPASSFESPTKPTFKTLEQLNKYYPDWTEQIKCCEVQDEISYGFLPLGTDLFRARKSIVEFFPDSVAWFGSRNLCASGEYGSQVYHFKTLKNLGLINMGNVNTIKKIKKLVMSNSEAFEALNKSFRIINNEFVLRASEKETDLIIAVYLKELFKNNNGINGWFHFDIKKSSESHETFHPEIMIFDIKNISYKDRRPIERTEKENDLLSEKLNDERDTERKSLKRSSTGVLPSSPDRAPPLTQRQRLGSP